MNLLAGAVGVWSFEAIEALVLFTVITQARSTVLLSWAKTGVEVLKSNKKKTVKVVRNFLRVECTLVFYQVFSI